MVLEIVVDRVEGHDRGDRQALRRLARKVVVAQELSCRPFQRLGSPPWRGRHRCGVQPMRAQHIFWLWLDLFAQERRHIFLSCASDF